MTQRIVVLSAALATLSLICMAVTSAQITETELDASDGGASDFFGWSVSISGDFALVGAYGNDNSNGEAAGSAYIFRWDGSTWAEQTKLIASDGAVADNFGRSVSLSGDYALIGADGDDDNGEASGSAYVFHYDGLNWIEQSKLLASDGGFADFFGKSVSLSGDFAIVGASGNENGVNAGSAYIFRYDGVNWVEQSKLLASDGGVNDRFGTSVSLSSGYALVGAYGDDDGSNVGSAYIFGYDGANWLEQAKLVASDGSPGDFFGWKVSLSHEYALVGAYGDDNSNGGNAGSAYIFHYNGLGWVEEAKLIASDGVPFAFFGGGVSLSGDFALVGANHDSDNGRGAGSAYIFHYDGSEWAEQVKLIAGDGTENDNFGTSVSLSGDYALVGASGVDGIGLSVGSSYVYAASPLCSKVSQFQARCRAGGLIKARVTMADASHAGETIEISIDDVPYQVVIDPTGRGQLSQGGFNPGPHIVELTDPGQCFDPIVVTCRTSLDEEANDDWDDELISETPIETTLLGNYPNPFNPSTTIRYTLSNDGSVSIRVYNMLGQEVATLVDGFQKAGEQSVTWNGTNNLGQAVASGLYIYRLQTGSTVISQKMLFAK